MNILISKLMNVKKYDFVLYLKLICIPAIWGGTFIAGRIASAHLLPTTSGALRFMMAFAALCVALQLSEGLASLTKVTKRQWVGTAIMGASGIFAYNLLFFGALAILPATRTSLFVALNPVVTVLLAFVLFHEKLSLQKLFGIAVALLGVTIVVTKGDFSQIQSSFGAGEIMMMGAVSAWAIYTLANRWTMSAPALAPHHDMSALKATTLAAGWGMLFLGLHSARNLGQIDLTSIPIQVWMSLIFLGVLGTAIAFVWYAQALQELGAAKTVIFNNLVPVFGVLFGWLLLGETLSNSLLLGGALAVIGVFIVNWVKDK
jgi:drug/metabolite transporter (DMT)-like permease